MPARSATGRGPSRRIHLEDGLFLTASASSRYHQLMRMVKIAVLVVARPVLTAVPVLAHHSFAAE
jgi:hypothetical protein